MQLTPLLIAAFAASTLAMPSLDKRSCPRVNVPAARMLCERWFGIGNNESRKCERLIGELAAQSCVCNPTKVLYSVTADHVYCSTNPCFS